VGARRWLFARDISMRAHKPDVQVLISLFLGHAVALLQFPDELIPLTSFQFMG
jgi:hypothetical protein